MQLKSAVDTCLKTSSKGKCFKSPHGPIGTWDVSRVTDMSRMFARAKFFDRDLSKWDVSRVESMRGMFLGATSFNGDLSKWDVSSVNDMHGMFLGATQFNRNLCGVAWVHSRAIKDIMFEGTSGSISPTVCSDSAVSPSFSPQFRDELKSAISTNFKYSAKGDGSHGPHGPIGEWDVSRVKDMRLMFFDAKVFDDDISKWDHDMFWGVTLFNGDLSKWDMSRVTDMSRMFSFATSFNGGLMKWDVSNVQDMRSMFCFATSFNSDISKWDVSRVQDMGRMFWGATSFNGDISKWDVSRVNDMHKMFYGAAAFTQKLCTDAWVHSEARKEAIFEGTSGAISSTACTTAITPSPVFSPRSRTELKSAIDSYPMQRCRQVRGNYNIPVRFYSAWGRDPYDILGVSRAASQKEVKLAYFKLAKKCHPDLHPGV